MKIVNVQLQNRSYPVIINTGNFQNLGRHLHSLDLGGDAFIISNLRICKLYGTKIKKALQKSKIRSYFHNVKDTEASKSISAYIKTITKISKIDTQKRLFLVALGGGVVGDLCGFIAATYKRGVPYIQIPTTLLAQVDSAIGGKTAIDLPSGKNLIGAFFQPRLVYSNISLLNSLPQRQIRSGLAEVVKYGVIVDDRLFRYLENNWKRVAGLDKNSLTYIISAASAIKAKIVAYDERETKGLRTILNFGHTIGHALETATKYSHITHGEAISIGMVGAAEIARELGILSPNTLPRITSLLKALKLPVKASGIHLQPILNAFARDKKFIHGRIRMVLPTKIGHVIVTEDIPLKVVKKVIKKLAG